ncbi:MAG TPA: ABC transporter permease [Ktedonobacteraceae bacterium]|nr:ABC transporter permease [Ktedonobacteraceae bacterium]
MIRFIISRFVGLIFVLLSVSFITFLMGYFAPGDPIIALLGNHTTPQIYQNLKHAYGLDLPWYQQYYNFLNNVLHGSFGYSFYYLQRPAWNVLSIGLPYSIELGLEVLIVAILLGIPSGIISALRSNTAADTTLTFIAILLYSMPDIALIVGFQVLMVILYAHNLPNLPVAGWDTWQARIAPVLITATTGYGYFARLTKTSMLEALGQDYIRTARSKGLTERRVVYRHTLRNACIPLITVIGPSLGFLVTGVFITEQFFNIPGVSQITLTAIAQRDYPVLQATVVLTSATVVIFNALTDVAYAIADPRIRIE